MSLEGKIALVTGTSRGIGREVALLLASRGATVIGTEINQEGADKVSAMLLEAGFKGRGEVLDVTDAEACADLVARIEKESGSVSILVNNAGITRDNLIMRMKDEDWDAVINTNLNGVYRMSKLVIRGMMKARWGRIINISSIVASMGNAGQVNYAAAKAGIEGFSRSLAREVASRGITVNCVAPGFIMTDMTAVLSEEQRDFLAKQIPVARLGTVADVANAVAFFADDTAGYITGSVLDVNGGMYMRS